MNRVSVIVPCYQEEKYIASCLNSLIEGNFDFSETKSEILIFDGMSTDKTKAIIKEFISKFNYIKLYENHDRYAPHALNKGIDNANGEIIVRIDAHCIYPADYISELVKYHNEIDAGNIGGSWDTLPGDDSKKAAAIAMVMTHPLGMGSGTYRTIKGNSPVEVDTVPFGCWRRSLFSEIGNFDTVFLRDQDYEHNVRIKKAGKKIILLPWLRIKYYARENFSKIFRMFFQYGYWRPLLNKKHSQITNLRQLVPPVWVIGLILLLITAPFHIITGIAFLVYISIWLIPVLIISVSQSLKSKKGIIIIPYTMLSFFLIHFSYGIGYISGFFDVHILRKGAKSDIKVKATR